MVEITLPFAKLSTTTSQYPSFIVSSRVITLPLTQCLMINYCGSRFYFKGEVKSYYYREEAK